MKPRLFRLSYFVWIIPAVLLYALAGTIGAPHVIWNRTWIDRGQGYDPFAHRTYVRCSYLGAQGEVWLPAESGRCALVRFLGEEKR